MGGVGSPPTGTAADASYPALRALWREVVGEAAILTTDLELTDAEVAVIYGLVRTPDEKRLLDKLMALR